MLNTNPFAMLAEIISPFVMQGFIILMIVFNCTWNNNSND